jgi:hypothetical protein
MAEPTTARLTSMHFYAWKRGLKTGMYYLRTRPKGEETAVHRNLIYVHPSMSSCCHESLRVSLITIASLMLSQRVTCTDSDFNYIYYCHCITADAIQFTVDQTALAKTKQADIDAKAGTYNPTPCPCPFPCPLLSAHYLLSVCPSD